MILKLRSVSLSGNKFIRVMITLPVIMLLAESAFSQSWGFGLRGGPLFSNVQGETLFEEVDRKGYHAGIFIRKKTSAATFLETGLVYAAQGTTLERTITRTNTTITWEINVNYLRMPLTFNIRPFPFLQANAGLYTAYLAGVSSNRQDGFFNSFDQVSRQNLNDLDIGAVIGSSLLIRSLSLGITWNLGFSKITNGASNRLLGDNPRNRALILSISYNLPFGGN